MKKELLYSPTIPGALDYPVLPYEEPMDSPSNSDSSAPPEVTQYTMYESKSSQVDREEGIICM